ncbi:MAG: hypothetical protein IPL61_01410 [Myxococcales bacterium]|nr:hypothetical protein [Myxococcales bacterium]
MLRTTVLGLLCAALVAACGHAEYVTQTQTGGIIRLVGDQGKAFDDAQKKMAAHCGPNNYTITQRGEEVIGKDTFSNQNTQYGEDTVAGSASSYDSNNSNTVGASSTRGGANSQGVVSERQAVEQRVRYMCGQVAPTGPAINPTAPPPGQPPM